MSFSQSIISISTKRPVTVSMFTVALLVFGLVLVGRLGMTLLPDLSYPTLTVRTEYPGAAPSEIENLISKPIEEAIGVVKNLRQVRSISRAGQSDVLLEFNWGADMGMAGLDVREKLDIVPLPLDVKRPSLLRFNPSLDPIIRMSLSRVEPKAKNDPTTDNEKNIVTEESSPSETASSQWEKPVNSELQLIQLRRFAEEEIKRRLESIEGIAAVKISGGFEDEVQVLVDQDKLAQLNLTIEQVASKLRAENVNLSGGRLEEGEHQFLVRTINQYKNVDEISESIITLSNGKPVYLKDIATVQLKYKERTAITRINGFEAVEVAIYKEGDANTVSVAKRLKGRLEHLNKALPENVELQTIYDQSYFIEQSINEVISNAIIGGILAMIILFLFLKDFRATVIISLSIPLSVIISFNMMFGFGINMNIMSLGGLALAIGLLVDNAIVVLENISKKKESGMSHIEAARTGAIEVAPAIIAATLTTIAVFLPLVFVEGIAGQLFSDQALTVTFALTVSLVVALTLIPMMASAGGRVNPYEQDLDKITPVTGWRRAPHFIFTTIPYSIVLLFMIIWRALAWVLGKLFMPLVWLFNKFYSLIERGYARLIVLALKLKFLVILIACGLLASAFSIIPLLGVELIPQFSQGELIVEIKAKAGTPLTDTDKIVIEAGQRISQIDGVTKIYSVTGTGNQLDASPDKGGENWGEINVVISKPVSPEKEARVITTIRDKLSSIPGVEVKITKPTLFSFKTPLEIEVQGYSLDKIKSVSDQIVERLHKEKRFGDVKSSLEKGYPEVQITFDHERAAKLGLSVPDIANNVVRKLRGEIATRYAFRDRKIDVLVRVKEDERSSVKDVEQLIVNPESDKPITLKSIADVHIAMGPSEIQRVDQERVAIISANLNYGDLGAAAALAQSILDELPEIQGVEVRVGGQNEEMEVSFTSLKMALLLAIFLVYLVMASQFESLLHPLVILFSIPLALVGAVFALFVTNTTISVVVFIGLIMLAGIVVNNAIVLIDLINQLREKGTEKYKAVLEACESRLRPIIMTTMTTALGMLPLALGLGEGAEVRAPMAITVIGGLVVSTLLTLVVIPVMYMIMDRKA